MNTSRTNVYSYVKAMVSINTLGSDTPLYVTETNKRVAHIEATRNQSYNYPVLTISQWAEAQNEIWRVSQLIRNNHVLIGESISSDKAAELYPIKVQSEIAEYAQSIAYQKGRELSPSAQYDVQLMR